MIPGSKLRELRHGAGVGLVELAARLGRSKQAIAKAETRDVTPEYAQRYLQAVYDAAEPDGIGQKVTIEVSTFAVFDDGAVTRLLGRSVFDAEH